MNSGRRVVGWVFAAVIVAGASFWISWGAESKVVQPINFSHEKHANLKLPCSLCHKFYTTREVSGPPGVATCTLCHAATVPKSPEMVKLRAYIAQKREIPWKRVYKVPDHVFYSHRTHVVDAKLPCATCHGPIEKQAAALTRPLKPITMEGCMECHRSRKVTNDCNACHR